MYLLPEELVTSGWSSFYLVELPYNLHLCSQNESNLFGFGKPKTISVLRGLVCVYMWKWMPPCPPFLPGMSMSLILPPSWWFGAKSPGLWLFREEKGPWAWLSPMGNFLLLNPQALFQVMIKSSYFSISNWLVFYLNGVIWVKEQKEKLTMPLQYSLIPIYLFPYSFKLTGSLGG